jgi:DNA repair protein RAD5
MEVFVSRGDTAEYADLGKLANRFLVGGKDGSAINRPTKAYVKEVVEDLKKGNKAECPICLEAAEDAVLTPCAHCMCRECLFASWQSYGGGLCPICRYCCAGTLYAWFWSILWAFWIQDVKDHKS